ncbi:MAG: hypothetical protein IPO41_12680 [Acidobacteria bacterium]|nr:hypothetical protein [Acidobacteriota bacterium]
MTSTTRHLITWKVLLVNPQGRKYILMGDAGGPVAITQNGHVTLTFTDLAGQVLPDSTALTRGKFEPTNWQTTINDFPAPAPAGPYVQPGSTVGGTIAQTLFGTFGQLDANGGGACTSAMTTEAMPLRSSTAAYRADGDSSFCLQLQPELRSQAEC